MTRRLFTLLALGLAVVLGLSACGGSSDESVDGLLKDTFAGGKNVKSGRLAVALKADLQGVKSLNGPIQLRLSGPFQSQGSGELPKFDFTLGLSSNGQTFNAGGVSLGDKGFVRFQNQAYAVSDKLFQQFKTGYLKSQRDAKAKRGDAPQLSALGIDPRRWLTGARKAGESDVAGTKTIHITAGVAVDRLLADVNRLLARASSATGATGTNVPSRLTPAQQQQVKDAIDGAAVDVYTGKDDHALRKLDVHVRLGKTGQLKGGDVAFTLEIDDLNNDQSIAAPKNAKPLDQLLAQLQGSAGGQQAPAPSTGGGSAAPPSATGNDAYLKCLQDAGQDLKKVQQCAALLK